MPLDASDNPARLRFYFVKLSASAQSLNSATDELNKIAASFDTCLKKLNLGVTVWVTFASYADDRGGLSYSDQIGYAKIAGKWGIAIRELKRYEQSDQEDEVLNEYLFSDAPRELRVNSVDKLPDLIEALLADVQQTSQRVQKKLEKARGLLKAVNQFADDAEAPEVAK